MTPFAFLRDPCTAILCQRELLAADLRQAARMGRSTREIRARLKKIVAEILGVRG